VQLSTGGGTIGPVELPAGNWYVFAMPESGGQPDGSPCLDASLVAVPYGQGTSYSWPARSAPLTVRTVPSTPGSGYRIVASTVPLTNCTRASTTLSGAVPFTPPSAATQSGNLAQGTWYVYRQRTSSGGSGNHCSGAFPVTIGWGSAYELDFATGGVTP